MGFIDTVYMPHAKLPQHIAHIPQQCKGGCERVLVATHVGFCMCVMRLAQPRPPERRMQSMHITGTAHACMHPHVNGRHPGCSRDVRHTWLPTTTQ